jgi:hypothetical protein
MCPKIRFRRNPHQGVRRVRLIAQARPQNPQIVISSIAGLRDGLR